MSWKLTDNGGDFQQPPTGVPLGRCVSLIDHGTQNGEYQGQPTSRREVFVGFELPNELIPKGQSQGLPFLVGKFYTASISEKSNLRRDLINWRGRDFTKEEAEGFVIKSLLNQPCLLTITLNDNGKAKVTGVTGVPKGTEVPPRVNDLVYFALEPDEFDRDVFDSLSDYHKKKIESSPEYKALSARPTSRPVMTEETILDAEEVDDGTIPF